MSALRHLLIPMLALSAASGCASERPSAALPALQIDPSRVAVVGLSSGAYMAMQAHLAWNERITGAALVAGGPYHCARGDLQTALGACMKGDPLPAATELATIARQRAELGELAPLDTLAGDRVLLLHAADDPLVAPALSQVTAALYRELAGDRAFELVVDDTRQFGHAWPTVASGNRCGQAGSPHIAACDIDAAGLVFTTLFGDADRPVGDPAGDLIGFDQHVFVAADSAPQLAERGFLYRPPQCTDRRCGLLVVFHGCEQHVEAVGERFVREAGFNRWADLHGVAVLYPQTRASYAPLNPKGCWDWWGYTGGDYDSRAGAQLRWLDAAFDAIGVPAG